MYQLKLLILHSKYVLDDVISTYEIRLFIFLEIENRNKMIKKFHIFINKINLTMYLQLLLVC